MKTKRFYILMILVIYSVAGLAQTINYSSKKLILVPESTYMSEVDWESLLYDKSQKNIPDKIGLNKQITIAPDESIFISDRTNFTITKLNKSGKVVKMFGKKGWNPGEFANNQDMDGILNNNLLVVSDNQGRINFFDLNGNFVKLITIDFMPLRILPTSSDKLIIYGHVPYGTKSKKLIAELDYNTEKYTQVYYTFESYDDPKGGINIPYKDGMIGIRPPFSGGRLMLQISSDEKIIYGTNNSSEIQLFTKNNGKYEASKFDIKISPIPFTEKEKEEYYQNFKKKLEEKEISTEYAEKVKEEGFFPDHLPYYYKIAVDDHNSCLFFIYSNEDKDHLFQAYSTDGKFLGESEFKIEGYDFVSKSGGPKFMNGYVYTLALKQNEEKPLRFLKCKLLSQ